MVDKSRGKPEEYLPAKGLTDAKEDQDAGNANKGVELPADAIGRRWIAAGCPGPATASCLGLGIDPRENRGHSQ